MKDSQLDSITPVANFYVRVVERDSGGAIVASRKALIGEVGAGGLTKCPIIYGGSGANDDITIQGTSNGSPGSSYVLLQPNGKNVGIGTTSPATALQVNGIISTTSAGTYSGDVNVGSAGFYSFNGPSRYVRFNTNGGANDLQSIGAKLVINYHAGQDVEYFGHSTSTSNTMFVNGNISLGGGSFDTVFGGVIPDNRKLTIIGGSSQTDNLQEWKDVTNALVGFVSPAGTGYFAGNVGIGTTTPAEKLDVVGNIKLSGRLQTSGLKASYVEKSENYTLTGTDFTVNCTAGGITITLLTAVGRAGQIFILKNSAGSNVTLATTSSQTIDGGAPGSISASSVLRVQSTGANWISI